jgi:hypothetical protein
VADYYARRQTYIQTARRGGFESGPEKIIKLGLNALYGKTAQQVGARYVDGALRTPPFFQLDWAGYVTAGCRAKLMEAAIQKPHAIIMFATDGLFSTEELDLDCPAEKTLGAWERQVHDGITVVMPGVYWLHDGESVKNYSRGFDKREMSETDFILAAWRQRQDTVSISVRRLITLGSACAASSFWNMRGDFTDSKRRLRLDGDNSKRYGVDLAKCAPWRELVATTPRDHFLPNTLGVPESAPYPISWLDGVSIDVDDPEGERADEDGILEASLA